ncbi:MAG: bifunctional 4-hydroxy-2-oxoglutarate aldolase/2-dehydro-3-deoxy-phosphogluconate aldolase [Anaerolineae bacterium]
MARFSRLEVLSTMIDLGLVPVFYHPDLDVAKQVVAACRAGGARVVEFTNRGDLAFQTFTELAKHIVERELHVVLGVGTIVDAPTAALYLSAGANFVVGPSLNPEVARLCNRRKVAYLPGCGSATEIAQAEELGVEIVKVFPGSAVGGPGFVKAVLGPMPWTNIMPTGGVDATEESIRSWFEAGVACVGIGSKLIAKDLVTAGNFDAISAKVAQVLAWIEEARL